MIEFRGAQIPEHEAEVLIELEQQVNVQFSKDKSVEDYTLMGFSVENNNSVT